MAGPFDYFVILAEMRTGSNFLEANVNAFDGLICHGEAFNPSFIGHSGVTEMFGVTLVQREKDPFRLLSALVAQGGALPGFRFFHDHDPRILTHVLNDRRCAKVILTRNPLDSYVSLKIAAATGQWKLTDMRHQRTKRIRFDPAEFRDHLDRVQGFQKEILHSLQCSGQTGFYLAYEDLQDLEVLNGLARFLGVSETVDAVSDQLKKQNPAPLSDKVTNFAEMQDALAQLDRFDLSRTPNFEPRRGPSVPGYVAGAQVPLLFMPIQGGPVDAVEQWLAALDGAEQGALRRGFTQKTLRQWKRQRPGHRAYTVVTHPLERAHNTFCDRILRTGPGSFGEIRATLRKTYKLPLPTGGLEGYGPDAHRAAFLAFLQFLKGNLNGQTSIRVDPAWATQSSLMQGMAQFALPDMVVRAERLTEELAVLAAQVGLAPRGLIVGRAAHPVSLSTIYDHALEDAARDAYQRDYLSFGYGAWQPPVRPPERPAPR